MTANATQFQAIFDEAMEAGRKAATAMTPSTMIVGSPSTPFGTDVDPRKPVYVVPEGPCGFAWVKVRPGNSPFANWLKKHNKGHKAYEGGVDIWISDYNQSMQRKEAHAGAMARVLNAYGITAYSQSRMD